MVPGHRITAVSVSEASNPKRVKRHSLGGEILRSQEEAEIEPETEQRGKPTTHHSQTAQVADGAADL